MIATKSNLTNSTDMITHAKSSQALIAEAMEIANEVKNAIIFISFLARFGDNPKTHQEFEQFTAVSLSGVGQLSPRSKRLLSKLGIHTLAQLASLGTVAWLRRRLYTFSLQGELIEHTLLEVRNCARFYGFGLFETEKDVPRNDRIIADLQTHFCGRDYIAPPKAAPSVPSSSLQG